MRHRRSKTSRAVVHGVGHESVVVLTCGISPLASENTSPLGLGPGFGLVLHVLFLVRDSDSLLGVPAVEQNQGVAQSANTNYYQCTAHNDEPDDRDSPDLQHLWCSAVGAHTCRSVLSCQQRKHEKPCCLFFCSTGRESRLPKRLDTIHQTGA